MQTKLTREDAIELLRKHNKEPFHILHGLTVGGVLKWYANELGYGDEAGFWEICGILHDIDFEEYPEEHCLIAPRLLKEGGAEDEVVHAVCSHGYGIHEWINAKPEHEMEKVLQRRHHKRGGKSRLGTAEADGDDDPRHEILRGLCCGRDERDGTGGIKAESL